MYKLSPGTLIVVDILDFTKKTISCKRGFEIRCITKLFTVISWKPDDVRNGHVRRISNTNIPEECEHCFVQTLECSNLELRYSDIIMFFHE